MIFLKRSEIPTKNTLAVKKLQPRTKRKVGCSVEKYYSSVATGGTAHYH